MKLLGFDLRSKEDRKNLLIWSLIIGFPIYLFKLHGDHSRRMFNAGMSCVMEGSTQRLDFDAIGSKWCEEEFERRINVFVNMPKEHKTQRVRLITRRLWFLQEYGALHTD